MISFLNDFIFCPRSIYFHRLYSNRDGQVFQGIYQTQGQEAHKAIDNKTYSTAKQVFQAMEVYSDKYRLCGKIDLFDSEKKILTERKKSVTKIYDGYVFQVYAQYFSLVEMGYDVETIKIYDMSHNKSYQIKLPEDDTVMFKKFENLIGDIQKFDLLESSFVANVEKCLRCIYSNLCDYAAC